MPPQDAPARVGPKWMRRRHGAPPPRRSEEERAQRRERLERYYAEQRRHPIEDDLAVFASYWSSAIACNPKAIYDKVGELLPDIRRVWVVERAVRKKLPAGIESVAPRSEEYFDLLARARWFVNNVNFANHYVKREGQVHVQTHHGTPIKFMGLDQQLGETRKSDDEVQALLERCARWDFSVVNNAYSTEIWRRAYGIDCESLEYGYPRNDVLVRATAADVTRTREALGLPPDKRLVLFAPTHREYIEGFQPTVDLERLARGLGDDTVLLTRLHYAYGPTEHVESLQRAGLLQDMSSHPSVEDLLLVADALVTDYSSVMFDYGVLDRPIVVHAPDWEEYRVKRGTYFDLLAEPPGFVSRDDDALIDAFRTDAVAGAAAASARSAFRDRFCSLDRGDAAERVVRRVWQVAA